MEEEEAEVFCRPIGTLRLMLVLDPHISLSSLNSQIIRSCVSVAVNFNLSLSSLIHCLQLKLGTASLNFSLRHIIS